MNTAARLIGFVVLLAALFAGAYALGTAVGATDNDADEPAASEMGDHAEAARTGDRGAAVHAPAASGEAEAAPADSVDETAVVRDLALADDAFRVEPTLAAAQAGEPFELAVDR